MNFNKIDYISSYGTAAQLPQCTLPEIVFSGRSNVGKSSLINKLFNRKNLARVSSVPGKTITINFFKGEGAYFVDLPGYGYAKREFNERKRWADLMEGYFQSDRKIAMVVQLIDMRHTPSEDDMTMLNFLKEKGIPFAIALTKCDKLNKGELESRRNDLQNELIGYEDIVKIEFSAVKGTGIEAVKDLISSAI